MEPVTTTAIALKLAPPVIHVIGGQLAGRLSADEEKRLRKALAEVLVEAAGTSPPNWRRHPFKAIGWRKDRKHVEKTLEEKAGPSEMVAAADQSREGTSPVEAAQGSWREALAAEFSAAAKQGLATEGEDGKSWKIVVGAISPKEWGERVQGGLEWRMAADRDLRHVLHRLDWGTEQASREADAYAMSAYLDAIPIALALGFATLLTLIAIAVILAVN